MRYLAVFAGALCGVMAIVDVINGWYIWALVMVACVALNVFNYGVFNRLKP